MAKITKQTVPLYIMELSKVEAECLRAFLEKALSFDIAMDPSCDSMGYNEMSIFISRIVEQLPEEL